MRRIGREHARHVARQEAGEDQRAAAGEHCGKRRGEPSQRPGEDVREDEVEAPAPPRERVPDAGRGVEAQMRRDRVQPRVVARDRDGDRIDVAGDDALLQRLRGGKRQDAGAGADVEHAPRPLALQRAGEGEEAAARRAVMPGAEGERRLDLDRKVVRPDRRLVMDAVDEEASGPHRLQPVERGLDPVLLLEAREGGALGLGADDRPDELAQRVFVGLVREIGLERPGAAAGRLKGCDRGLARVEDLAEELRRLPGRSLVGRKPHHMGRTVRVQAFEHAPA